MNLRLSILLVTVLVLFGGTFLIVRSRGSEERVTQRPWFYQIDDDAIARIAVTYKDQTVTYEKRPGSRKWYIQEDPEVPVFIKKWAGTALLLSGPRADRVLAENIDDPASYGLDPPETNVLVTERGGQSIEFHLGNPTPDGRSHYARLVGTPALFTVNNLWAEAVSELVTEPPYPRLYLIEEVDEENDIRRLQVNYDGRTAEYIKDRFNKEWSIKGDPEVLVHAEKWEATLPLILNPWVTQVLSDIIEDAASYGLDPPRTTGRLTKLDGNSIEFHLGIATPDEKSYYARVVGQEELMIVPASWAQAVNALATDPPYPPEGAATAG